MIRFVNLQFFKGMGGVSLTPVDDASQVQDALDALNRVKDNYGNAEVAVRAAPETTNVGQSPSDVLSEQKERVEVVTPSQPASSVSAGRVQRVTTPEVVIASGGKGTPYQVQGGGGEPVSRGK